MTDPLVSIGDSIVVIPEPGPPSENLSPSEWVRKRLFSTPLNGVLSVILALLSLYIAFRTLRFIFVTGRWEPVSRNLELFTIGLFDREERWRVIAQVLGMAAGVGLILGSLRAARHDVADDTGEPFIVQSWQVYAGSYWSILLFVGLSMAAFVRTPGPWLVLGGVVILAVAGWLLAGNLPRQFRAIGWTLAALSIVISFQMMTGTGGWAWAFVALALVPFINDAVGHQAELVRSVSPFAAIGGAVAGVAIMVLSPSLPAVGALVFGLYGIWLFVNQDRLDAARVGVTVIIALIMLLLYRAIGLDGTDWSKWSGLHLNLVVTTCAILLSFPIGVLLALGRRSSLPAVRFMSVIYIEFFRGAPLITFLLAGQFFLGFFLNTDSPLSSVTRATAAITLFSAAYIAEIVRGGLQAVPLGQIEAGRAGGLSEAKITRLIVMPQALRAVIPAMVGQFISLFKDTSLLTIISITEFLGIREIIHGQADFRGFGIAETLTYVAFGFWAFAFAMSRESQRLERRLGVGSR